MKDISNRKDIELLVDTFYQQVLKDDLIGHIFTEVAQLNFEQHMPIMHNFWESMLLDNMVYQGNPMLKHLDLHRKTKLDRPHFDRWLSLWNNTIDELYAGEKANMAKTKAKTMADLMLYKIEGLQ